MPTDDKNQMTLRVDPSVHGALAKQAASHGQELADYAADLLTDRVLEDVMKIDPSVGKRLKTEIEVKARVIALARRFTEQQFDPHVTLKVFREIQANEDLRRLYLCAIGSKDGFERGNHIKARINRSLGAAIKTAVRANSRTVDGNRAKIQVSNEFIFSYTELESSAATD